jgi:hypothetical protein
MAAEVWLAASAAPFGLPPRGRFARTGRVAACAATFGNRGPSCLIGDIAGLADGSQFLACAAMSVVVEKCQIADAN